MAADENESFQFANLGDADNARRPFLGLVGGFFACPVFGLVIAVRRDPTKIRVIAGTQPAACLAVAAGRQLRRN